MTSETIVIPAEAAQAGQDNRRWWTLALVVAAQFMVVLDVAIVNVALPSIKTDLHFTQESLQWVVTAYAILFGGALLLGGRMGDLLGRRRMFIAGLALFTVSSLLDGLAWSEGSLIAFRSLQGLGAALLSPAALSILTTTFKEGRERNIALGVWGAASGSGGAAGVLLGGVLTSAFGWSWIFFVNLPVGVLLIVVAPMLVHESRADLGHRRFDAAGAVSITSGLMLLVYAMTRASQHGWGTTTSIGLLAVVGRADRVLRRDRATVARTAAADADLPPAHARDVERDAAPRRRRTVLAVLPADAVHAAGAALLGAEDRRRLHRTDRSRSSAFSAVSQSLVTRIGIRKVLPVGLAMSAAALVLYARLPVQGHYFWDLFPAFLLCGIGLALSFVPMVIGGLTGVKQSDAGVASGLFNTSQQVGGAIGVAAATTIATTFTARYVNAHPGVEPARCPRADARLRITFYVLAGLMIAGGLLAALFIESQP